MATEYLERAPREHLDREILFEPEPPVSVSRFAHVLRGYRQVILLLLTAILLAYGIVAIAIYLFSSAQQVTMQPFRLDFAGAGEGRYPNGTAFTTADIINGPTLLRVYGENHLANSISFGEFSRSVFVLESNSQYDALAAEYQARLADQKLSSVDRERIEKEFELKRQSIAKNDYAISFSQQTQTRRVPETIVRKVLLDTLNAWADFAVNQQHVTSHQVSVLSAEILRPSEIEKQDLIAAIQVLRGKINRIIGNITTLQTLPGANLARTPGDRASLEEVRLRLEEIIRYRLEPLVPVIFSGGLISDRITTIRFLENQLAYDKRQLEATQLQAEATLQAMATYEQRASVEQTNTAVSENRPKPEPSKNAAVGGESVVPQLSDTFLDRLITISGRGADAQYRQKLVDDYRSAISATIPLQQAVAYDTQALNEVRGAPTNGNKADAQKVRAQIEQARAEVSQLIEKMNELFQIVNRNMSPSTQLLTLTGPPSSTTLRVLSVKRLMLYGLLVFMIAIPIVIMFCLLHNRIREEEATEEHEREVVAAGTLP